MDGKNKKRYGKQAQELIRFRVADYLWKKQGTQKECAAIFGISQMAVNRIWAKYRAGGKQALRSRKRGAKGGTKLKKEQARQVRRLIREKMPDQLKLPFGLWTREAVQQLWCGTVPLASGALPQEMGLCPTKAYQEGLRARLPDGQAKAGSGKKVAGTGVSRDTEKGQGRKGDHLLWR